jgi:hypothetical protein
MKGYLYTHTRANTQADTHTSRSFITAAVAVVDSADDRLVLAKTAVFCMGKRINRMSALSTTAISKERTACLCANTQQ